jgi:hypothetical protein
VSGRPRDHAGTDIEASRPTIAPDVDELARKTAAMLGIKRTEWLWNSIEYRVRLSPHYGEWVQREDIYLEELDTATAGMIRRHVTHTHGRAVAAAKRRGWEVS